MWFLFVIGFHFGIFVVEIVTAAARVVVVISNNFCVFISCGGSRCICSCSGVNRSCGGSSIAHLFLTYHYHYHHHHHSQHHNHHLHNQLHHALPHTIHLPMALLMMLVLVTTITTTLTTIFTAYRSLNY